MSDKTNDEFDETVKEAQEEFDLDKRIMALQAESQLASSYTPTEDFKSLLRDFSKYVTPSGDEPQPNHNKDPYGFTEGFTHALKQLEANTRKVLGDEH